jgi:hypothetical protein
MNATTPVTIEAVRVPAGEPMEEVLPRHFGKYMLRVEDTIYCFARHLCPELGSSVWRLYELSNGGFYMAPMNAAVAVRVHANNFDRALTGDAAGVTACLYALRQLAAELRDDAMNRHYYQLLAFARQHAEADLILAATN